MATMTPGLMITLEAGQDLSSSQFFFMDVAADGQVDAAAAGADAIGVLQNKPDAAGKAATIQVSGVAKVYAGGTVTAGDQIASDAAGEAVVATPAVTNTSDAGSATDPLIGSCVLGRALDSGVNGDVIRVLLMQMGAVPTTEA